MKILYISSSVGLGHVTRDYRLSLEFKKHGYSLTWITSGIALEYLKSKGETVHYISNELKSMGDSFEKFFKHGQMYPGVKNIIDLYKTFSYNKRKINEINLDAYDAIISDEGWEMLGKINKKTFFITDFEEFSGKFGTIGNYLIRKLNSWYHDSLAKNTINYYIGLSPPTQKNFKYFGQVFTHGASYPKTSDKNYILVTLGGTKAGTSIIHKIKRVEAGIPLMIQNPNCGESRFNPLSLIANSSAVICMGGYGSLIEVSSMKKRAIINVPYNDFEQESNAKLFKGKKGYRVVYMNQDVDYKNMINGIMEEEPDPPVFKDAAADIVNDIEINL